MEGPWTALRHAARTLRRSPGFTSVALLTLALGIGANTAVFSVVSAALLRPLPYLQPDRLVVVGTQDDDLSPADYLDVAARNGVFEEMAAYRSRSMILGGEGEAARVHGVTATANLLHLLGVSPMLGRSFSVGTASTGPREALIGYALWQRRFGGRRQVLGQGITVDGEPATVVGVMRPGFAFPAGEELWLPPRAGFPVPEHPLRPLQNPSADRGAHYFESLGRLHPGLPIEQARAHLDVVYAGIVRDHPDSDLRGGRARLTTFRDYAVGDARPALLVLLGAVALVLLIACANVANLSLARGTLRTRELAVREALGASRPRLVRMLLIESSLLAALAAGLGGLLAVLALGPLASLLPPEMGAVSLDGRVLGFTALVSAASVLLFGLWPALLAARQDPSRALRGDGRSGPGRRRRAHGLLVLAESALAVVLLVGAGLLVKSLSRLLAVDPGFQPQRVLTMGVWLPTSGYADPGDRARFAEQALAAIGDLPGISSAAVVTRLPLNGGSSTRSFSIEGRRYPPERRAETAAPDYSAVSPNYFRTLGVPLLAGRDFDAHDTGDAPPVAIVSAAMERRYWPGRDPVGRRIKIGDADAPGPWIRIVGVAGDVHQHELAQGVRPTLYVPYGQDPWTFLWLAVRSEVAPRSAAAVVTRAIRRVDSRVAVDGAGPLEAVVSRSLRPARETGELLGALALLALTLAAAGVFSVTAFAVSRRTREIGIRVTLGASRGEILRLLVLGSARPAAAGILLGLAGAEALSGAIAHLLFRVAPTDPATFATVAVLLLALVLLASWLPARRGTRIEPTVALRCE